MKSLKVLRFLLAFAIHLHLVPSSDSQTSPVAIHPERNKLLEDALSWLTLRRDGKLLTPDQCTPFLEALRKEYRGSRHLRVVAISFQYGVLPKLTLGQGATCEPAYTDRDKDYINHTITWYKIKDITQALYSSRNDEENLNRAYCDYRQGLICHSTTKKCECPEGSKMGPIEENSPIQRCQVEEDQPCALADLAISATNEKLAGKLHEIIFNLEKPPSCEWGTQCRHKGTRYTKCISTSKAPFDSTISDLNYGEECVLDYIGEKGNCEITSIYNGATCYNFWGYLKDKTLPSGVNRRMGFCAMDLAPYMTPGVTYIESSHSGSSPGATDYFIPVLVNPRTVKMSSSDLLSYDKELHQLTKVYRDNRIQNKEGELCSVADTTKMKEIWNFYHGLEGNSPPGQDFVADLPTLNAKLTEYKNLLGNKNEPKICRVVYELRPTIDGVMEPMICDGSGSSPDAAGNDGKCVNLEDKAEKERLIKHARTQRQFFWTNGHARNEYQSPDSYYYSSILWSNPDKLCTQAQTRGQGRPIKEVRNENRPFYDRGDVLEDGTCQDDRYSCFEDLSDWIQIYVDTPSDCNFKSDYEPKYGCFDVINYKKRDLGQCENFVLIQKIKVALETTSKLGWAATCDYQMEQDIPIYVAEEPESSGTVSRWRYNGYRTLLQLQSLGICDPTKLLECSEGNTCKCIENTEVRKSADGKYSSEYCYLTTGPCIVNVTQLISLRPEEEEAVRLHYGDPQSVGTGCSNGNACKFIDPESETCTATNTGKTGVDVEVEIKLTTEKPGTGGGTKPLEPPVPFGGSEMTFKRQTYSVLVISMIIVSISSLYR